MYSETLSSTLLNNKHFHTHLPFLLQSVHQKKHKTSFFNYISDISKHIRKTKKLYSFISSRSNIFTVVLLDPQHKGTTVLQNVSNYLLVNMTQNSKRPASSSILSFIFF